MSRYTAALNFVLGELDRRRQEGYDDWRASASALGRLRSARPMAVAATATTADKSPAPPAELPAPIDLPISDTSLVEPPLMPTSDDDADALSLFDEKSAPAAAAASARSKSKSAVSAAPSAPGVYEPVTDPAQSKEERLAALRACPERLPCAKCPYGTGAHGHIVFGVGNVNTELMFVGEAPGADEDAKGEPFVGRAGQLLNKIISTMGYQREDIYLANVLKCRPDTPGQTFGNRPPRPDEMTSCRPCLFEQIDIIQPKAIVALGATAMKGLLDLDAPMRELRGRWHDFKGTPVMATYHPSYLLRNQAPSEKRKVWEDLLMVKEKLGHKITERDRGYFLTKG